LIAESSRKFSNIISVIRQNFKNTVDISNYEFGRLYFRSDVNILSVEILKLEVGKPGSDTIKSFCNEANIKSENLEKIGA
jgi:hypothetical protein